MPLAEAHAFEIKFKTSFRMTSMIIFSPSKNPAEHNPVGMLQSEGRWTNHNA